MEHGYMSLREVLNRVQGANTYESGVHTGIKLMQEHYHWVASDWVVEYDDMGSDYRLLVTTLKQLIKEQHEHANTHP